MLYATNSFDALKIKWRTKIQGKYIFIYVHISLYSTYDAKQLIA